MKLAKHRGFITMHLDMFVCTGLLGGSPLGGGSPGIL